MKRINEAKFRSPKWLRNYFDFEVNTGDDITGQPSERRIKADAEKAKKEAAKKSREYWSKRWKKADPTEFKEFYKEVYNNGRYVYSSDLEDIYKKWKDDNTLWDSFDKWLDKKRKKKEEQEQIEKDLKEIYNLLFNDFKKAPYSDKIETPIVNGETAFHYTFENGKLFRLENNKIYWDSFIFTVGHLWKAKFVNLANDMIKYGNQRSDSSSSGYKNSSSKSSKSGHPKSNLYNTLKQTIKQREEQLSNMSKDDPNRRALENELEAAKKKASDMKAKYHFENIKSYEDFNFTKFNQIFESSKFIDQEEFNSLLDKISDEGIQSLSDIEKKRLNLFSQDDKPIYDLIDQMADITLRFKDINQRMDDLTDAGKLDDAKKVFKDEWQRANDEMIIIEREIESYGIELGDQRFVMMMKKHRPDAYGYDPNREDGLEEMEI